MSEWQKTTLGESTELLTGFPFKSANYTDDESGIALVRGDNVVQGRFRWDDVKRWPKNETAEVSNYFLQTGDVILAMDRPWIDAGLKYACVANEDLPCLLVQRVTRLRARNGLDQGFLRYVIGSREFTDYVLAVQTGTAVPHISSGQIKQFQFQCPPSSEQRAIAAVLGSLDDKIELNRRMNETLEALAQSLFKSWFVDATQSALPKGWKVMKFGEFIERLSVGEKYDQKSASPSGKIPILDQGKSGVIGFHNNEPGVVASLEKPVVVFANHTCYMRLITFPFSAIQNVLPFVGAGVDTLWAYYATQGRLAFSEYKGHWPDFVIQETVVPPEEFTKRFADIVRPLVSRIQKNEEESRTLAALRDALLPKLLSGELRVPAASGSMEARV